MNRRLCAMLCALVAIAAFPAQNTAAQSKKRADHAQQTDDAFALAIRKQIDATISQVLTDTDFEAAEAALAATFDQVVAYADASETALIREAALALRLIRGIAKGNEIHQVPQLTFLRENPEFARTLGFLLDPRADKPAAVFRMMDRLRVDHAAKLNDYADLAAAVCVVHDREFVRQINENRGVAPNPVAVFEYYLKNEKEMFFGMKDVPAELLVYVVDTTSSVKEMEWALKRYARHKSVGDVFFEVPYDYDHFLNAEKKKVTVAGWNLPNILKHGGVCADQAYYAMTVAKAIGVPSAYVVGAGGEMSHAWVGYLQSEGRHSMWNFNVGRYEVYQGVAGNITEPQTRRPIRDAYVSLLADFVSSAQADRHAAAALADAANRLLDISKQKAPFPPPPPAGGPRSPKRAPQTADVLALVEAAVRSAPAYAPAWHILEQLAADGKLSVADKKKWEGVLFKLCGERYPDFYVGILTPMIKTIESVNDQNAMWNAVFSRLDARHDLAAAVRMEQAAMWLKQGETAKAGQCYEDVISRFANAGPFVIGAINGAEKILSSSGDDRKVVKLYERAWSFTKKPGEAAAMFAKQSNWFKIGSSYLKRLESAGMKAPAAKVKKELATIGDMPALR
jgi:hypothetical protein